MTISILNYNCGNIGSISNSLGFMGVKSKIIKTKSELSNAKKLILPGVGNYQSAIEYIDNNKMRDILLKKLLIEKIPTLAICLGMQLLFKNSDEHKSSHGLGIYKSKIRDISIISSKKINKPFIGWQKLVSYKLNYFSSGFYYFAHSYALDEKDVKKSKIKNYLLSKNNYLAYFYDQNIIAMQFHPEKSGSSGKEILKKFSEI